jgi:hypothetical protein
MWHFSRNEWKEWSYNLTGTRFRGLWGYDPQGVLAVGTYLDGTGATVAMAVRQYNPGPTPWTRRDPMPANMFMGELTAVWGTSKSHVFSVANNGKILHHDGTDWLEVLPQSQTQALNSIWGRSATDVFAVGNKGSIQHYDGASWTPMASGTNANLHGVWADAGGVYAVGDGGVIIHLVDELPAVPGGNCPRPVPLYCGPGSYYGDTTDAISMFESYGSCTERKLTGGEVYYRFDSPITGHIVAHLTSHVADLDLLVLGADGDGGCAPMDCRAASQSVGATEAQARASVKRDETYYVVVDGANGAASGYTLTLECTPG